MDWVERQEYYDLIEEEIKFSPQKGQKWILTLEERHTYDHDILFHVYAEGGDTMLLVFEIVDVMELEIEKRLHKLSETLSGNFRILLSTLVADLPAQMERDATVQDGSRFKLSFAKKDDAVHYEWEHDKGDFKRIRPVLKLIWAVDHWRPGAKAMGWSGKAPKEGKPLGAEAKRDPDKPRQDQKSGKGRIDPFGLLWEP